MHRKTGLCENCIVISLEDFAAVHEMRRLASKRGTDKRDVFVYHKRPSL